MNAFDFQTIWNFRKASQKLPVYRSANLDHSSPDEVEKMLQATGITHRIDLRSPFEILENQFIPKISQKKFMANRFSAPKTQLEETNITLSKAIVAELRPTQVFKVNRERKKETENIVSKYTVMKNGRSIDTTNINFITMNYIDKTVWDRSTKLEKLKILSYMMTFRYNALLRFVSDKVGAAGLAHSYYDFLDHSSDAILAALKVATKVLSEGKSLGINCAYGKDRTGLVTSTLKHIVGDSESEILDDYERSEKELAPHMNLMINAFQKQGLPAEFAGTPRQALADTIAYLKEKYGSWDGYLDHIGFDESWRGHLRNSVLHNVQQSV